MEQETIVVVKPGTPLDYRPKGKELPVIRIPKALVDAREIILDEPIKHGRRTYRYVKIAFGPRAFEALGYGAHRCVNFRTNPAPIRYRQR